MHFTDKKILITGGAGFIGSHLAEYLVNAGAQVTILDNLSTGLLENIETIKHRISFIHDDITNTKVCHNAVHNKDIIFHLAALISVPESVQHPDKAHHSNVTGTFNMLEAARIHKVQRFIFSSSAAIYGPYEGVCSEAVTPNPTSMYGLSKFIGEYYCKLYAQSYGMKTISLRYFNVWGSRQRADIPYPGVVANIRHCMQHNKPITLYGNGLQTRDFIHVTDVVQANCAAAKASEHFLDGRSINIATGKSISLKTLIQKLKDEEFMTYAQDPIHAPGRTGDIQHSQADISELKKLYEQLL